MLPYGYYLETGSGFSGHKLQKIKKLLAELSLEYDPGVTHTAVIFDPEGEAAATASLEQNIFKCIGISRAHQGEGLTADLFSALLPICLKEGYRKQFLYTKPENEKLFMPFGFTTLVTCDEAALMERPSGGIDRYLASVKVPEAKGRIGAVVAHANPFTNGHLYLIRQAAAECDFLYVFILSEDKGAVPAAHRIMLVREGTGEIANCRVCPTDQYMISRVTFPAYFLHEKSRVENAWCELDASMFARRIAPALGITHRYAGSEPLSPVTEKYNRTLADVLPSNGIALSVLPRLEYGDGVISASRVRQILADKGPEEIRPLVPPCTYRYFCDPANLAMVRDRLGRPDRL